MTPCLPSAETSSVSRDYPRERMRMCSETHLWCYDFRLTDVVGVWKCNFTHSGAPGENWLDSTSIAWEIRRGKYRKIPKCPLRVETPVWTNWCICILLHTTNWYLFILLIKAFINYSLFATDSLRQEWNDGPIRFSMIEKKSIIGLGISR